MFRGGLNGLMGGDAGTDFDRRRHRHRHCIETLSLAVVVDGDGDGGSSRKVGQGERKLLASSRAQGTGQGCELANTCMPAQPLSPTHTSTGQPSLWNNTREVIFAPSRLSKRPSCVEEDKREDLDVRPRVNPPGASARYRNPGCMLTHQTGREIKQRGLQFVRALWFTMTYRSLFSEERSPTTIRIPYQTKHFLSKSKGGKSSRLEVPQKIL